MKALRSEPPLVLRATTEALYLVGGAGGPLGGDDLELDIEVGPGARLTIRTAAASLALPGDGPSVMTVTARVAADGELRWLPEPVVAVVGCDHRMSAVIVLEDAARLVWREEIVLGRHCEASGSVVTTNRVDLGGAPLLRHELALGPLHPAAAGPAVTAGARAIGSLLLVGVPCAPPEGTNLLGTTAAVLRLERGGTQVLVLAGGASELRRRLETMGTDAAAHTRGPAAP